MTLMLALFILFFQAEDGIRDVAVTGVQTCALPILVLVCNSKRRRGKYVSFGDRVKDAYRKRGICFMTYPTFSYLYYKAFILIGAVVNKLLRRPRKVYSLEQISRRYGAKLIHTRDVNSQEMIQLLRQTKPDLIITACFDQLVA